ncbi:hypothetical protein AOA59_26885 [Pseudomonas sp. 2822-15]|nr:hypothetical protein AOA59_26885 [Pseudomonas sp. 2822-15]
MIQKRYLLWLNGRSRGLIIGEPSSLAVRLKTSVMLLLVIELEAIRIMNLEVIQLSLVRGEK